jgi:hypothetical protein
MLQVASESGGGQLATCVGSLHVLAAGLSSTCIQNNGAAKKGRPHSGRMPRIVASSHAADRLLLRMSGHRLEPIAKLPEATALSRTRVHEHASTCWTLSKLDAPSVACVTQQAKLLHNGLQA